MQWVSAAILLVAKIGVDVPKAQEQAAMRDVVERYATDRRAIGDFYFTGSEASRARREAFLKSSLAKLDQAAFERLARDGQVDWILLRNELEYRLKAVGFERRRSSKNAELLPFRDRIYALEEQRWKVAQIVPEQIARELDGLASSIKEVRKKLQERLDKAKDKKADVTLQEDAFRASKEGKAASEVFESWFKNYDGFKPLFSWWVKKPYESAKRELDDYLKFLRETVAGVKEGEDDPLIGDPIGRDELQADLDKEMIPYTVEELIKIAEREYAWCEAELKKAAGEMGFGTNWKKALEQVKTKYVQPGEQDQLVASQAREAIEFVKGKDLVTIEPLCEETWRIDMLDAKGQRSLPFAAYGGQKMLVAFPLSEMDNETKLMSLRGNNVHFTRAITQHELIPGHHLQGYMAQRYNAYRSVFSTPFYGEGWALYWEMLLWDLGFPKTPEDRIGMLFWRIHRAARIIVSLNFHTGKMKPQEMIDYLVEKVGQEKWTATSEVRRFIGGAYSPLYQCAYMIGGLQLRALAREMTGDGKMTLKQFHDAVLRQNSMPIVALRAALGKEPLTKDWKPTWKFDSK